MRVANVNGRLAVERDMGLFDVAKVSDGHFGPDPQAVYDRWEEFVDWVHSAQEAETFDVDPTTLLPPTPSPRQIFAIGMNYRDHVEEIRGSTPESPSVFTKFVSSLTGARAQVPLPVGGSTDWEVELVVVMGRRASNLPADRAWDHVAGLTVGQDISERKLQTAGSPPQFSLGKSYPGFAPMGPWLVTPDEFENPDDLAVRCELNGEVVQSGRTSRLIFPVPDLIARLSAVVTLLPGDVIFTGTPAGVGAGRVPPRFLSPGDELISEIEGIGTIVQQFVEAV